jgi:hypothetical protein
MLMEHYKIKINFFSVSYDNLKFIDLFSSFLKKYPLIILQIFMNNNKLFFIL